MTPARPSTNALVKYTTATGNNPLNASKTVHSKLQYHAAVQTRLSALGR